MYNSYDICKYCIARQVCMFNWHSIIIIIIERRDFGGIMSNDCEDTLQNYPHWAPHLPGQQLLNT